MTYFQAVVIGLLQGVTELFPVSSLGHAVLFPSVFGWDNLAKAQSADESFFLAFLVALHVATALALILYFRDEWLRIVPALFRTVPKRRIDTPDERLAWLLVVATIPVGIIGLVFEHALRTIFAKPAAAAAFLVVNGVLLLGGEWVRRRSAVRRLAAVRAAADGSDEDPGAEDGGGHGRDVATDLPRLATLDFKEAGVIGLAETAALFAGISRSGVTMVAGLARGLDHADAARFSFLLATPVILAAGVYKLPDLLGPLGDGIRAQALVGALVAGVAAWFSVRFLVRWFETRTLWPFGVYCLVAGALALLRFA
ncbi:MAG: undecaprenyl-diphosphate phosphatase [Acidimicrobiales bacterium]